MCIGCFPSRLRDWLGAGVHRRSLAADLPKISSLGKDPTSKPNVRLLPHVGCFCAILKSKNCSQNHPKLRTFVFFFFTRILDVLSRVISHWFQELMGFFIHVTGLPCNYNSLAADQMAKCLPNITSLDPPSNPRKWVLLSLPYKQKAGLQRGS